MSYLILKYVHILGASVLLGTGVGIAFFMLLAHRSGDARVIAGVARIVVIADYVFTASAVVLQPITGALLVWLVGYSFLEGWVLLPLLLLCGDRTVLAPRCAPTNPHARSGDGFGQGCAAIAGPISPSLPPMVRLRHSGLCLGACHLLADDRAAHIPIF